MIRICFTDLGGKNLASKLATASFSSHASDDLPLNLVTVLADPEVEEIAQRYEQETCLEPEVVAESMQALESSDAEQDEITDDSEICSSQRDVILASDNEEETAESLLFGLMK